MCVQLPVEVTRFTPQLRSSAVPYSLVARNTGQLVGTQSDHVIFFNVCISHHVYASYLQKSNLKCKQAHLLARINLKTHETLRHYP